MKSTTAPVRRHRGRRKQSVSGSRKLYANAIEESLWKRPDLPPRDRSLVTVSALIARNQTIGMLHYFNIALDSGVTPRELSETVTHLAFDRPCCRKRF